MYRTEQSIHTIQPGDYPYQLAKKYQTTVEEIMALNPHVDPHNLIVGTTLMIPIGTNTLTASTNETKIALSNAMRLAWEQHVYWTRMLLISIAAKSEDQQAITQRLLENPKDIARIFRTYYTADIANTIAQLLTVHLQIGAELITALRDNKVTESHRLQALWYQNADQIANAFHQINPYYEYSTIKERLYSHLHLTTQEVEMHLAKNYVDDIHTFDMIEQEAMDMADMFSTGILYQFPETFKNY